MYSDETGSHTEMEVSFQRQGSTEQDKKLDNEEPSAALTKQDILLETTEKCREYFKEMDINGDGKLDGREFAQMMQHVGMILDVTAMKVAYTKADKDGDGEITFKEFIDAFAGKNSSTSGTSVQKVSTSGKSGEKASTNGKGNQKASTSGKDGEDSSTSINNKESQKYKNKQDSARAEIVMSDRDIKIGCRYFWESDKDRDGKLNIAEFSNMLLILGMQLSDRDVKKAFRLADLDRDGFISFGEYVRSYLDRINSKILPTDKIIEVFHKDDMHCKGFLTIQEFSQAMSMLGNYSGEGELKTMVTRAKKKFRSTGVLSNSDTIYMKDIFCFLDLYPQANRRGGNPVVGTSNPGRLTTRR